MATRLLDETIDWKGRKADNNQALEWPRSGMYDRNGFDIDNDEMPTALINATAEMARWLIASDRTAEADEKGFKVLKAGSLELQPDIGDRKHIIPQVVASMLLPFGTSIEGSPTVKLVRV